MWNQVSRLIWRRSRNAKTVIDVSAWLASVVLAFWLRLETGPGDWAPEALVLALVATPTFFYVTAEFQLSRQSWAHVSVSDLKRLAMAVAVATLTMFFLASLLQSLTSISIPRAVPVIAGPFAFLILGAARLSVRVLHEERLLSAPSEDRRALIIGAGDVGAALERELRGTSIQTVGFLDESPERQGLSYGGAPVLGGLDELVDVASKTRATHLFLAHAGLSEQGRSHLTSEAERLGLVVRAVAGLEDILASESPRQIQSIMRSLTSNGTAKNVLVIGGAGYIGSALVPLLLDSGFNVRVLDSMIYGRDPLGPVSGNTNLEILEGDFRNVDNLVQAMQGIDTVVHLGAIVGDPACNLDEDLTVETNLMATRMVAEIAKGFGITRFLFASSCSVYGVSDDVLDETSDLAPVSLYAKTKVASERVLAAMETETFRPIILRFATVYGFSGRTRFDLVVNLLTAKAEQDGLITLFGGDQWRPFVHVGDLARAILRTVQTPLKRLNHRVYNIGSDEQNMTLRQAAELIQSYVPESSIEDYGTDSDLRNYRVDFSRFKQDTGFEPAFTVADGVEQVLEALRTGQVKDVKSPEYSNVQFLTEGGLSKLVTRVYGNPLDVLAEAPQNVARRN